MEGVNFQIMAEEVPESTTAATGATTKASHRLPLGEKTNAISTASVTNDMKKVAIHHTATTIPPPATSK
jgi:hypothetical protein